MTRPREHVPHRPRRRRRGHGRGRHRRASSAARACTSATASATAPRRPRSTPRCWRATCSTTCRSTAATRRSAGPRSPPPGSPRTAPSRAEHRKVYDVRDVARALVDGGRLLEVSPRWARNIVCAFARLDGRAVGIVANQPRYLGGVLDAEAAQKAARFVRTCNLFGLPLVVLVDTPGFLPGTKQEQCRRDPPRRQARLRVRRGDRPARDRRSCARRSAAPSSR